MKQKQLFNEGLVKTPFVGITSEPSRINTPNTDDNSNSIPYAPYSPAYAPTGRESSPTYGYAKTSGPPSDSPAYHPNTDTDSPAYHPNTDSESLPLVGSPYNPSTPEQTNILEVEEPPVIVPAEGDASTSGADVIKTITL